MKISEFIQELEEIKSDFGDIDVVVDVGNLDVYEDAGIRIIQVEPKKVYELYNRASPNDTDSVYKLSII